MELSIFNLLTGSNPNASVAENPFFDAIQDGVSDVPATQQKTKAGEAFLKALEQARTGKMEKDADILYNTLCARVDAASSLKDLKTGNVSRDDVKVVKLHIKRTRASETLRKADEQKAAVATPSSAKQSGQKIPTREKIAVAQENTTIRPDQNTMPKAPVSDGFEAIILPEEAVAPQESVLTADDELTAADILITSALQTTFAPLSQTRQETIVQPVEEIDTTPEQIFRPEEDAPVFRPAPLVAPQKADEPAETEIAPQIKQIATEDETDGEQQNTFAVLPQKTDDRPVHAKQTDEKIVSNETVQTKKNETDLPVFRSAVKTDGKKEVHTLSAKPVETVAAVKTDDTQDVTDFQDFQKSRSDHEARRQAGQLVEQLPAGNKIAISVEIETPVAKIATPFHKNSSRFTGIKGKGDAPESDLTVFAEQNEPVETGTETAAPLSNDKAEQVRHAEQQTQQTDQPDGLAIVTPVQNKVLSEPSTVTETAQNGIGETSASPTAQPSAAPFTVGHELKGKAVSGSVPVQKNLPVNELVDQIKVNIKKALKEGLDKIDIVLKPKELGTIKIHLEIGKDGTMKAVLNTARAETLDLLQSDLTVLKQALADSGFDLNDQAFSFNYRGERYNDEQKHRQNGQNNFSAEQADDEIAEEAAGTLSISGRYALNIRV